MDFGHWLSAAAGRHPDRVAVEAPGESVTYRELLLRAVRAAGGLHMRGVRRGEPVALMLEPGLAFVEALHGCLLLGAPAVPIDPRLADRERDRLLREIEIRVERPMRGETGVFELPHPPERDDVALVMHTSGTTGRPQPVALSFGNIRANARGLAQAMGLGEEERWLSPLPLAHVGGLMVVLRSALMGTTAVLSPPPFDEHATAAQLREGGITTASLVPTQLQRLLDAGATPGPSLRRILLGGGPMPRALLARARGAGFPVCPSYGLTQACSSGTVSAIGSLRTGDLGHLDARGRLVVTGRKGDVIISGGENVAPAEVEAVLAEHPDVAEAAVFARPHALWGEAITALVVARDGADLVQGTLRAHCLERLAAFKVPKAFELVDELPRTESGKVRRAELR